MYSLFSVLCSLFFALAFFRRNMLQTEFEFTLPCGYVDEQGNLHRQGIMRRATALDEVDPLGNPRVRANEAYLSILLLGRVIVRLGTLTEIGTAVVERL